MAENDADVARRAERFAEQVGAELTDLPPVQRARVLDDLAAHLRETNEEGVPLLDQQGSPQDYAAELRSALTGTVTPPSHARSWSWRIAAVAGLLVAVIAAVILLVPRLSGGQGSDTSPVQTQTAQASPAVAVPNLIGLTQAQATSDLIAAGLSLGRVTQVPSTSMAKGVVAAMSPAAGSGVPSGSAVDITVSSGTA